MKRAFPQSFMIWDHYRLLSILMMPYKFHMTSSLVYQYKSEPNQDSAHLPAWNLRQFSHMPEPEP